MGNLKGRSLHFLPVIREAQRSFGRESFAFIFLISVFFNIIQNRTKLLKHPLRPVCVRTRTGRYDMPYFIHDKNGEGIAVYNKVLSRCCLWQTPHL